MITIAGGVYDEYVMHPDWRETYGSAGRAASAISELGAEVELHTYADSKSQEILSMRAALQGFMCHATPVAKIPMFKYIHSLATPEIYKGITNIETFTVTGNNIIRYGMIAGDAITHGNKVVYDAQNTYCPSHYHKNGSTANHLALILNLQEAKDLTERPELQPDELAKALASLVSAEVIIIKLGPKGCLAYFNGDLKYIPAYKSQRVWKLGSGDIFTAYFGFYWMHEGRDAFEAANLASLGTARYCETAGFGNQSQMLSYKAEPVTISERVRSGYQPTVYLAGPFFNLSQRWQIEQARDNLKAMQLHVFSPFHDVGKGAAEDVVHLDLEGLKNVDAVLAIGDGLDSGTLYEVGYARALEKPVIFYVENESQESIKMMAGSDCIICDDYVSAIYQTLWTAVTV